MGKINNLTIVLKGPLGKVQNHLKFMKNSVIPNPTYIQKCLSYQPQKVQNRASLTSNDVVMATYFNVTMISMCSLVKLGQVCTKSFSLTLLA